MTDLSCRDLGHGHCRGSMSHEEEIEEEANRAS
jgi:hypothetical protein